MNECHGLCVSINNLLFEGAPKRKVSSHICLEHLKLAYMTATVNELMFLCITMKEAIEKGYTPEEILGDFQIRLQEAWSMMAKTKMGSTLYKSVDLETIAGLENPSDILKTAARMRCL